MRKFISKVICKVFGHSRIVHRFRYTQACARCHEIVKSMGEDGGFFTFDAPANGWFPIGHTCPCVVCHRAYMNLTWMDKLLAPKVEWPLFPGGY